MALTESTMLGLGTKAPHFTLPDTVSGKDISLANIAGKMGTVVMFICNHCPYVIHVNKELVRLANDYSGDFSFVAISSNDAENYPQDGPEFMKSHAAENNYPFPYLYDESQNVAKAYDAACTPDFYLFDADIKLAYRGRLDGSSPGNVHDLDGKDLRSALDSVKESKSVSETQYPSMGCNIKWK